MVLWQIDFPMQSSQGTRDPLVLNTGSYVGYIQPLWVGSLAGSYHYWCIAVLCLPEMSHIYTLLL